MGKNGEWGGGGGERWELVTEVGGEGGLRDPKRWEVGNPKW